MRRSINSVTMLSRIAAIVNVKRSAQAGERVHFTQSANLDRRSIAAKSGPLADEFVRG